MKNILFLLDYYCEDASANGICCKNVARELARRGYRVFVGSYRPASAPAVEDMDGVRVVRTWTMPDQPHHKSLKERVQFYGKWCWPFHKFPVTEIPERTEAIYSVAKKLIPAHNIDTVVCVHLPVETLIAGTRLKTEFPEVRFCGYMLDSLSGGILPRFLPARYAMGCKIRWESALLEQMDLALLMESSRTHHEKCTEGQIWMSRAVYGDIPQILPAESSPVKYEEGSVLRMVYAGTLADDVRSPYHFLRVLNCVSSHCVELLIAGNNRCSENLEDFVAGNKQVTVKQLGPLPHDKALQLLKSAHILVNFGNINNSLLPSKIFEYMSLGKPIISTTRSKLDTARRYLAKYPYALELDELSDDYQSQARELEGFFQKIPGTHVSAQYVTDTFYANTPGAFVDILTKSLD